MTERVEQLFTKPPSLANFFNQVMNQDFSDSAQHLLNQKALTPRDEVWVVEVFDYLSGEGFRFLFPKILQAYLDKVFVFDGNLTTQVSEAIWREDMGLDRKHGRGARSDNFAVYSESLSPEHAQILRTIIHSLQSTGRLTF